MYILMDHHYLDLQFPKAWIDRRGPVEWPPRSADLSPLNFYLWGHLKTMVYQVKIRNINYLKDRITTGRHSLTCANACSSTVENAYQYVYLNNGNHIKHYINKNLFNMECLFFLCMENYGPPCRMGL